MSRSLPDDRLAGVWHVDSGLGAHEVETRRAAFGDNSILEAQRSRWIGLAIDTATDPMVWFLLGTALLFFWVGDRTEAVILTAALVPITGMDAFLHWRTMASTAGLRDRLAARARVMRDGHLQDLPATALVAGDLVHVAAGDWFPADGLLEGGAQLQVDESILTGEAMPVAKHPLETVAPRAQIPIPDTAWASAGTRLLTGSAQMRVVFTGKDTLYGQIARSVQSGRSERTPLQRSIARLVAVLLGLALLACLALALSRYVQGHGLVDALLGAATLAIAALPEEFPVVFTFFLGVGVMRLARRRALVRRAVAVENIGRVTCICADKTGTLTRGELSLAHIVPAGDATPAQVVEMASRACRNDSADPLDLAILAAAPATPLPPGTPAKTFPFTEDRRKEVAVLRTEKGYTVAAKGAPETILAMTTLDEEARQDWLRQTGALAASAHKVIACASRDRDDWDGAEPRDGFTFSGLLAFEDPLRSDAGEAVAAAQGAGIRVIMVTGDYAATAAAVAAELGLGDGAPVILAGEDLARRLADPSPSATAGFNVVARATPAHKLALVERLRQGGEIVAVTGDGVNDAPALRAADVGIAMAERGAQTTREVAAIVLLDDSFRTIVAAIREGRQLFRNLQLSFAYLLMVHAPLVITAAAIPLAGQPLLYLPTHIVWLELIIHPTALLVFQEQPADGALAPAGRTARRHFFDRRQLVVITLTALLATALVSGAYIAALAAQQDPAYARSAALAALVLTGAAITAGLSRLRSRASRRAVAATIASAVLFLQVPPLATLMHLAPLHLVHWAVIALGAAITGACARQFRAARGAHAGATARPVN